MRPTPRWRWSWTLGFAVVGLLGLMLVLQVRWLGQLAEAQLELTPRFLERAAARMASECQSILADVEAATRSPELEASAAALALVAEVVALEPEETPPLDLPAIVVRTEDGRRLLAVLDLDRLQAELFPALVTSALGAEGLETYRVAVVPEAPDGPALYRSQARDARDQGPPDASAELWLRGSRRVFRLGSLETLPGGPWFPDADTPLTTLDEPLWVADRNADGAAPTPGRWRIEIRHREGSLAGALERTRRRNLFLAGGLLTLVLLGSALLWGAEQRARRLAEKELAFVAGVSHELRTPLTVVRTAASNLARGVVKDPAQVARYGRMIEQEVERVSVLAERVLRFSDDGVPTVVETVDVEAVIRSAVERLAPWRDRRRFEVAIDVAPGARSARADPAALTSALHNLIENAVKYGPDGQTIRVRARRAADLVIEVTDEGPGIAPGDRARVFEPFYRAAGVRAGGLPGSGLGLGVARDIARAHGGRLELVEPASGAPGATFALHLPAPATVPPAAPAPA